MYLPNHSERAFNLFKCQSKLRPTRLHSVQIGSASFCLDGARFLLLTKGRRSVLISQTSPRINEIIEACRIESSLHRILIQLGQVVKKYDFYILCFVASGPVSLDYLLKLGATILFFFDTAVKCKPRGSFQRRNSNSSFFNLIYLQCKANI